MNIDENDLFDKERQAWNLLKKAQNENSPDIYEKLHKWSNLYYQCVRRKLL